MNINKLVRIRLYILKYNPQNKFIVELNISVIA
jgi:hypothetical protein